MSSRPRPTISRLRRDVDSVAASHAELLRDLQAEREAIELRLEVARSESEERYAVVRADLLGLAQRIEAVEVRLR